VNLLESHSRKAHNVGANLCSFGCAVYSPGRDCRLGRGFMFHALIIRERSRIVNRKVLTIRDRSRTIMSMGKRKNPAAVALGRKGGKKGGPARAASMTPEERSASARNAVQARWAKAKTKTTQF